jgi:hypothetical protein
MCQIYWQAGFLNLRSYGDPRRLTGSWLWWFSCRAVTIEPTGHGMDAAAHAGCAGGPKRVRWEAGCRPVIVRFSTLASNEKNGIPNQILFKALISMQKIPSIAVASRGVLYSRGEWLQLR